MAPSIASLKTGWEWPLQLLQCITSRLSLHKLFQKANDFYWPFMTVHIQLMRGNTPASLLGPSMSSGNCLTCIWCICKKFYWIHCMIGTDLQNPEFLNVSSLHHLPISGASLLSVLWKLCCHWFQSPDPMGLATSDDVLHGSQEYVMGIATFK